VERTKEGGTLVEGVMRTIRHRIEVRELVPGSKLPSLRSMAETLEVSKSTVVEAYDRLAAEGSILSRPGSGFRVAGHVAPLSLAGIGPDLDREVDPLWISRQSLETGSDLPKPGCGWLPPSWMPTDILRRAIRSAARAADSDLMDYSSPLGLPALRRFLAQRMVGYGLPVPVDRILLTDSGTQSIDLLCRFLIRPGDAVIVDDPCYFNFHALLRAHQARVVGVPWTPLGPDLESFAQAVATHDPRLYITNSAIHNPTGATLSPLVAHRILEIADRHDIAIVEDDIFADFESEPAVRLSAFGGLDRVVQTGSFSKSVSGAARCGYVVANPGWIQELVDLKIAVAFGGNRLAEAIVFGVLKDGGFRKHMESLRLRLSNAMREAIRKLEPIGIVPWVEPRAGMFLWCHLPRGSDAARLAKAALEEGIVLAPGNVFSLSHSAQGLMRFNVSQMDDPRIYRFLARECR